MKISMAGVLVYLRRGAMRAEDYGRSSGYRVDAVDKDYALALKRIDDFVVMDDLMISVDWTAAAGHDPSQACYCHLHAGAKTARSNQQDAKRGLPHLAYYDIFRTSHFRASDDIRFSAEETAQIVLPIPNRLDTLDRR
jgi:hypothetical protein